MENKLTKRLAAIAEATPRCSLCADVGTDHAYLPIFLVGSGKALRAIASDINQGPCERARMNIAAASLEDYIEVVRCNGIGELQSQNPDSIIIAGMGGELISSIIASGIDVAAKCKTLTLQPMTRAASLRQYLCTNGFEITYESLVYDDRIYQIIQTRYDGKIREISEAGALLGEKNIINGGELFRRFAAERAAALRKKLDGMKKAGNETSDVEMLYNEVKSYADGK